MSRYDGPLLWCDLETTGDEPRGIGASILEVGIVVTAGPELNVLAEASMLIRPPGGRGEHDRMWAGMPQVVRDMHEKSGLWHAATNSPDAWTIYDADLAIGRWLRDELHLLDDGPIALAGAGVSHLDLPWIKAHMPRLASSVLYWPMDISPLRRLLQYAGRDDLIDLARDVDAKPHRALADARLHVAEGRRYIEMLRSVPEVGILSCGCVPPCEGHDREDG